MHMELPILPGARVGVHMPGAVPGRWENGQEVGNGLPPYSQIKAHRVDDYPGLPEEWARSSDGLASYVIGLKAGRGLWLDFRSLMDLEREMAARLSVQGLCALTGYPTDIENDGDGMALIQFRKRCLRHPHVEFGPDRYCSECGFKWPMQNYLSTTGTHARFGVVHWIDGFRMADGKVRQFLVTADTARGVAFQVLGERRTFYYEVALYESVNPKPPRRTPVYRGSPVLESSGSPFTFGGGGTKGIGGSFGGGGLGGFRGGGDDIFRGMPSRSFEPTPAPMRARDVEQLEIAAGAVINQIIGDDPNPIEFWKQQPVGRFRIYYMPESQLTPIIEAEQARLAHREGFLGHVPIVGNPGPGGNKVT